MLQRAITVPLHGLLLADGDVGEQRRQGCGEPGFHVADRLLPRAHPVDEVLHVVARRVGERRSGGFRAAVQIPHLLGFDRGQRGRSRAAARPSARTPAASARPPARRTRRGPATGGAAGPRPPAPRPRPPAAAFGRMS